MKYAVTETLIKELNIFLKERNNQTTRDVLDINNLTRKKY